MLRAGQASYLAHRLSDELSWWEVRTKHPGGRYRKGQAHPGSRCGGWKDCGQMLLPHLWRGALIGAHPPGWGIITLRMIFWCTSMRCTMRPCRPRSENRLPVALRKLCPLLCFAQTLCCAVAVWLVICECSDVDSLMINMCCCHVHVCVLW